LEEQRNTRVERVHIHTTKYNCTRTHVVYGNESYESRPYNYLILSISGILGTGSGDTGIRKSPSRTRRARTIIGEFGPVASATMCSRVKSLRRRFLPIVPPHTTLATVAAKNNRRRSINNYARPGNRCIYTDVAEFKKHCRPKTTKRAVRRRPHETIVFSFLTRTLSADAARSPTKQKRGR